MNGNVFQCFEEQSDRTQFETTLAALDAYTKKNLIFVEDLRPLFGDEIEEPKLEELEDLPQNYTETQKAIWDQELREYFKRKGVFKSNLANVYAVVFGQCSEPMKDKIRALKQYKEQSKKNNCVWLLQQIQLVTLRYDEKTNGYLSLMSAQRNFLTCKQGTLTPSA